MTSPAMSGERVDVIGILDAEIARAGGEAYQAGRDLIEVRAAAAELIEAIAAYHPRFLAPGAQPAYSEDGKRLQAAFARIQPDEQGSK